MELLLYILLPLALLYVCTCLGYFIFHRLFLIFPSKKLYMTPGDMNIDYEEHFLKTSDHKVIQAWALKNTKSTNQKDLTIIFFSGNKGSMSKFLKPMNYLLNEGYNVFLFGYRGFGKSSGKWITEKGVYRDSEAVIQFLNQEKKFPFNKMIFMGQSLGCAMASNMASRYQPLALILEAGFPSIPFVAQRACKWLPLDKITTSRFETQFYLRKVKCPVLVIHSQDDKAIPISDADILINSIPTENKKKVVISGPHAEGLNSDHEKYIKELSLFLENYICK